MNIEVSTEINHLDVSVKYKTDNVSDNFHVFSK